MNERLKKVFREVLRAPVGDDNSAFNTPGWDSLAHVSLIAALEREFSIKLNFEESSSMLSVKAIEEILNKKTIKCLVLDLDGILWEGIIGEEGAVLTEKSLEFQRRVLELHDSGTILAVNSKNNEDDAMEMFNNPRMILKKEHFASIKTNWDDKATNMRQIAKELNIGLESMAFIDDNPVERELIRQQLPEVQILKDIDDFKPVILSEEDKKRGEFYQARILVDKLEKASPNLEDFYRSLKMRAVIKEADESVIPRLAQMCQKTNQFNLTTRRYTENDIAQFIKSNDHRIYYLRLIDKFIDNGIVSMVIILTKECWEIDTFLMSCRIMNRTVETAFLSHIVSEARKDNIKFLLGKYIPTEKNKPVRHLYQEHGFGLLKGNYTLELSKTDIKCPDWIEIK
jgi:FkbH-like protein